MTTSINTQLRYDKRDFNDLDPVTVFLEARKDHPEAFFFEAAPMIDSQTEISIVGFGPYEVLRDIDGRVDYVTEEKTRRLDKPFFAVLEEKLSEIRIDSAETGCRFQNGGIFGCVGYDAVSEIEEKLKSAGYFKDLPTRPELSKDPRAEVLITKKMIVFDHKARAVHLIDGSPRDSMPSMLKILESSKTWNATITPKTAETPRHGINRSLISEDRLRATLGFEKFKTCVEKIKHHVREGDIFQAVLAERFECHLRAQPIDVFLSLRRINPAPYSFFFSLDDRSFFGASPEALIRIEGKRIISHPIAGTRRRGHTPYEDRLMARSLSRSRKEAAEHLMLVDLARNDLGRVATPGSVQVREFRTIRYLSNVMHLVSEVEAELAQGVSALSALQSCFPAGTLSGAPKIRAMEILAGLETVPRGLYGGAVVAFDSLGNLDSCISIRSLETRGETAILRAGAGIVADSRPEFEYAEVSHKLRAIREAIADAESMNEYTLPKEAMEGALS